MFGMSPELARAISGDPRESEEERRLREEREAWERYVRDNNILREPILVRDEIERYERETGARPKESFSDRLRRYGDADRSLLEDRRFENPPSPLDSPQGWPHGWGATYDPRWLDPATPGKLRDDLPPEVRQGLAEAEEWHNLRAERDLIDDDYEPTDSPLVLRKRNANGTVTYVHSMTGQPLFDEGFYGMNDPQGAETESPLDSVLDPFWRAGRRDW